jgi:hypothetical protein
MKKIFFFSLLLIASMHIKGQANKISLNLSPTAGYTWWDNQLFIKNGPMVGGVVGIGLGRNLELRGIYEQSVDLKSTLNSLDVPMDIVDKFNSREVDVTRWGGEFKANIPTQGILSPYITLGSGVQKLKFDDLKQEQIYLTAGLGTRFYLGERVALNLEGKLHAFNLDAANILRVNNPEGDAFNDWIDNNISNERMMNWSLNVGIQFYLGDKNPNNYSALERALDNQNSNGLKGLRFVFEPGGAYINFDNSSNLRNTYLLGGALGVDFNDYVGLRAFYYRSTEDEKVSFDFDNMAMYGADFIAKLNVSSGIVPYITMGGGYMNVYGSYVGNISLLPTNSSYFAKGGVGLTIPVSRYVEVFGAANLLLTTDKEDPIDVESTEDLKKHTMFNAGLKFNIGKKANTYGAINTYVDQRMSDKTMMYEQRIAELKKELDKAYEVNDIEKAAQIINEKQRLETEIIASANEPQVYTTAPIAPATVASTTTRSEGETMIRLTPAELESMIDKVVQGVGAPVLKKETPEERLDRLERMIMGQGPTTFSQQPATYSQQPTTYSQQPESRVITQEEVYVPKAIDNSNQELLNEMKRISDRIEENSRKIDNSNFRQQQQQAGSDRTFIVSPGGNQTPYRTPPMGGSNIVVSPDGTRQNVMMQNQRQEVATSWVIYKGLSPFLAMNFGDATSFLFGLKANYGFSSTDFVFTPDLYFGIGGKVAFGLNANVTYPLFVNNTSIFTPYVGIGLGINKVDKFDFGINFIAGSYLDVGNGSLFVEYTSRRAFKNNLISLGYRFDF